MILVDGRLSFDALQRRLDTSPAKARQRLHVEGVGELAAPPTFAEQVDQRVERAAAPPQVGRSALVVAKLVEGASPAPT